MFHRDVFIARRNNLAATRLALVSAIEHAGAAGNSPRRRVPRTKRMRAMGLFTRDIKTMNDLFVHQLQDIYYAEKQLVKALPKMAEKATDQQLKQGFLTHLDETKTHVQRVEQVFQMQGLQAKAIDCPAIDGIIKEANQITGEIDRRRPSRRALRDHALRQPDRVGEAAWPQRLRQRLAEDARGRKGNRQEVDHAGGEQDQSPRGELIFQGIIETKRRAGSPARRFAL